MTIKRKNIRPSGLLEVEADNTDTIDLNGFSDSIQTVGAKTAKFSGGATMQANPGLRIGMTQLKINTGSIVFTPRGRTIESSLNATNPANAITPAGNCGLDEIPSNVVADFTSIATADLHIRSRHSGTGPSSATIRIEVSDDNISYSLVSDIVLSLTITDFNLGSQTWRYVRVSLVAEFDSIAEIHEIFEEADSLSNVTVKVHSSTTIDTANGTEIISNQVMLQNETLTFDTDLLLTGNPTGDFVTLEIVSFSDPPIPVTLSEITSIKEV